MPNKFMSNCRLVPESQILVIFQKVQSKTWLDMKNIFRVQNFDSVKSMA